MDDYRKDLFLAYQRPFKVDFQIKEFKESRTKDTKRIFLYEDNESISVRISIHGKGHLCEDNYMIFKFIKFGGSYNKRTLVCSCILNILDVAGEKKCPRSFKFLFHIENHNKYVIHSERYVERDSILSNASEYLHDGTLTVTVEGTLEEWVESGAGLSSYWKPENYRSNFKVCLSPDLKVYLHKECIHAKFLIANSRIFRVMLDTPMRERTENCILLRNEELPAFMCMLLFIEARKLIFYEATIFDLYKLAHLYEIPILLEECRKYIEKYLSETVSSILNFARCYSDPPKRNIDNYSHKTQENNPNVELENKVVKFECDTYPFSVALINTEQRFKKYLKNLLKKMKEVCQNSSVIAYWTPKRNEYNFKIEMNDQSLKVYLQKDSEHNKFLVKYSNVFREFWDASLPETAEKFFPIRNEELRAFLCMLCFIESKKLILHEVTVFDMYKIAHQYDVPMLLDESGKYIENIPTKTALDILNFATFYGDKDLESIAGSYLHGYSQEAQDGNIKLEVGNAFDFYFVCDTHPISNNLIQSEFDFSKYLRNLWKKVKDLPEINTSDGVLHIQISEAETYPEEFDFYR